MSAPLAGLLHVTADACRTTEAEDTAGLHGAVHELDDALRQLHADIDDTCNALPDRFGWCIACGADTRVGNTHKRGGNGCISGVFIPFLVAAWVRAAWRRAVVRIDSPAASPRGGDSREHSASSPAASSAPGKSDRGGE